MVVPQNGWFIVENPIKMNDLGIPLFLETPICDDVCVMYDDNGFYMYTEEGGRSL